MHRAAIFFLAVLFWLSAGTASHALTRSPAVAPLLSQEERLEEESRFQDGPAWSEEFAICYEVRIGLFVGNDPINKIDPFGLSGTLTVYSSGTSGLGNHSWVSYTPDGGSTTTYGTWGNNPGGLGNGLLENLEQGRGADATRAAHLNDAQEAKFNKCVSNYKSKGDKGWKFGAPCSSFACQAWNQSTGEHLDPYWLGISNPTSLTHSITDANGGVPNGTANPTGGSSSYGGSIGNSSSGSLNSSVNPLGNSSHGSGSF